MFLLESVEGGAARGRYSMIGLDPDVVWRVDGERAEINRNALARSRTLSRPAREAPLEALRALIAAIRASQPGDDLPPMAAGVFGYLGYDMVRQMEQLAAGQARSDRRAGRDHDPPDHDGRVRYGARRDFRRDAGAAGSRRLGARAAYRARAASGIDAVVAILEGPLDACAGRRPTRISLASPPEIQHAAKRDFLAMVERAKDYIRAGDIFQVVLSQRFTAPFALPAFSLYRALRRVNPSPFLCYLDFGSFQIVCSSPEILVRVRDGKVTIRPIAGTRWRGKTQAEDEALAAELLADRRNAPNI